MKNNIHALRDMFPIFNREVHEKPLVYLDNAATTQRPQMVIDAVNDYYTKHNANIHRGVHLLSQEASAQFEETREKVKDYINAPSSDEVIFVRGTTEGINLVAASFANAFFEPGDEVVVTHMEHHSNIVPWQMVCEEYGAKLRVIPMKEDGSLNMDTIDELLTEQTKMLAVVHISNALGTVNPVKELIEKAHAKDIPVLVDGAQAMPHTRVDVQDLDADFYVFSGHKMYGPTGAGVLYGKREWLDMMPPYQGGGDMIRSVSFEKTEYAPLPAKFEAGTPDIAAVIGLGAAIDFMTEVTPEAIAAHEKELLDYTHPQLQTVPGLKLIGTASEKAAVASFVIDGVHPHDIGTIVDMEGVAIRTGHHCAEPVMQFYGVPATSRISLAVYNTTEDIDKAVSALKKCVTMFQ